MNPGRSLPLLAFAAVGSTRAPETGRPQIGRTLLADALVLHQDLERGMRGAADSLGVGLPLVAGEWDLAPRAAQGQRFLTLLSGRWP